MTDFEDLRKRASEQLKLKRAAAEFAALEFEATQARLRAERGPLPEPAPKPQEADAQITVGQLKALLAEYPDDMLVQTEGCDCYGPCSGVDQVGNELLITRSHR